MQVKKAIKKIAALSVGATMLGATLLGATAATYDLSQYPAPFVMDGQFNGLMVVGDDAAPADIIGVTDIAIALQFSSTTTKTVSTGGTGSVAIEGDAVKFERSGDVLELNELLGNCVETFDAADAEGLKSFTVSNSKGTTDVNQYLRFKWDTDNSSGVAKYTQDDLDRTGDFLYFADGEPVFQYDMEFEEGFESDIDSDWSLSDLEDETLHVLGEDFAVTKAELKDTNRDKLRLELMGGAVHDTLEEGETRTYTIDGKDYEVTVLIITDSLETVKTKFKINGQVTKEMSTGDTEVLADGTSLGIRELLPNEAGETAGGDLAEFYLGANKFVIEGKDENGMTVKSTVDANEENLEDVDAYLDFTKDANTTLKLHKIVWRLNADGASGDEAYLASGQGIAEWLDEPEGMWSSSWDIKYQGMTEPGDSIIEIKSRGDDEYRLSFESMQGIQYTIPLFYATTALSTMRYGDDDDHTVWYQGTTGTLAEYTIDKNDYFVVSHNGLLDSGVTRVLKLDSIDTSNDQLQLTDAGTGGQITAIYTPGTLGGCDEQGTGTFNVGGYTFDFRACYNNTDATTDKRHKLFVDLSDDGLAVGGMPGIVVNGGGILTFANATNMTDLAVNPESAVASGVNMTLKTESDNFDENTANELISIQFTAASTGSPELDVSYIANSTFGLERKSHEDNEDIISGMTNYGVYFEEMNEDNDPDTLTIKYPLEQRLPQAFIVFEGATVREGGAGTVTYEVPNRIEIGAALLASQVSDATAANILSVGGACVNEVTAGLLGLPYPSCGEASGLMEGEGIIKLVENGDKVAVIVAGWEAEDTTRATRVLADWKTWQDANKLVGTEVKVTGTSLTNYDVSPVTATEATE